MSMSSRSSIRVRGFGGALFATLVGLGLSACEGCGEGPGPGPGEATLVAAFPRGNSLENDNVSRLPLVITGRDAARDPDTSPITVTAATGFLSLDEAGELVPASLVVTPDEKGAASLFFFCDNDDGNVSLEADNGNAKLTFTVTCVPPQGAVTFDVDDSDCDDMQADGEDNCNITVQVDRAAAGGALPQLAAPITVRVLVPENGELVSLIDADPQSEVTVTTQDSDEPNPGLATFQLHAPRSDIDFAITVEIAFDGQVTTADIVLPGFENKSKIEFSGETGVVGGSPTNIGVTVTAANGGVPSVPHTTITARIEGPGATISAPSGTPNAENTTITGVELVAGLVDIAVATPIVDQATDFTLTIEYEFLGGEDPVTESVVITASELGALLLNLTADPTTVKSDDPARLSSTLTVAFTKDNAPVVGGLVTLTINDPTRLTFQDGSSLFLLDDADFDANGNASVDVNVEPGVAPSTVVISADGSAPGEVAEDSVDIRVLRDPILQSLTPSPPVPAIIGVRGSSLETTSTVTWALKDDLGDPMPGVRVTFSSGGETADLGISLTDFAFSDAAGQVTAVLASGTIAGPVSIIATAASGDGVLVVRSLPIIVVGGTPNHQSSFMTCGGAVPFLEGADFSCTAVLLDRFGSDIAGQGVQFRAEGSGTNAAAVSNEGGQATALLVVDDTDTLSATSVPAWSHGFFPNAATFNECFDNTITTPCDLLQVCQAPAPANECPLQPSCLSRARAAAQLLAGGLTVQSPQMAAYVDDFRACGFPVSCLSGDLGSRSGVPGFPADDCVVAPGCMDYSSATECPHDGLVSVMASTRGEEPLGDGNGNGVFDFDEIGTPNGIHDFGEPISTRPELCLFATACEESGLACSTNSDCTGLIDVDTFIDLPEPFLDKNDSCTRDDLTNSPRLAFTPNEKVRHSDLFSDVDGNGSFGFTVEDPIAGTANLFETNGVFDATTEMFLTAHTMVFGQARLLVGTSCAIGTAGCIEVAGDNFFGINPAGIPSTLPANGSVALRYRWSDGNGNCVSEGFGSSSAVAAEGPIAISGDETQQLDEVTCGFASSPNVVVPYCEDFPALGAPVGTVVVVADCEDADDIATMNFTLDGVARSLSFAVDCVP